MFQDVPQCGFKIQYFTRELLQLLTFPDHSQAETQTNINKESVHCERQPAAAKNTQETQRLFTFKPSNRSTRLKLRHKLEWDGKESGKRHGNKKQPKPVKFSASVEKMRLISQLPAVA